MLSALAREQCTLDKTRFFVHYFGLLELGLEKRKWVLFCLRMVLVSCIVDNKRGCVDHICLIAYGTWIRDNTTIKHKNKQTSGQCEQKGGNGRYLYHHVSLCSGSLVQGLGG